MLRFSIFLLFGSLLATPALARDVCWGSRTNTDPITGETSTQVKRAGLILDVVGTRATVTMPVGLYGVHPDAVPAGTEILMALDNGTKLHFFLNKDVQPSGMITATQYSASVSSHWELVWALDSTSAHAIAQSRPIALRYSIGEQELKPDYKPRLGNVIASVFACAAELLPPDPQ